MLDLRSHGLVPFSEMEGALAHAARGVPLHGRDGQIRAFATVDAEDFQDVAARRWYRRPNGYVARQQQIGRKRQQTVLLHRELLGLAVGDPECVDHRDHDPLNCVRSNLRTCTHAENHQNRRRTGDRGSSSRFRGVSFAATKGHWVAHGTLDGKFHYIGGFATEEEAAEAARAWRREHMPYAID